jgi:hypothetical protein
MHHNYQTCLAAQEEVQQQIEQLDVAADGAAAEPAKAPRAPKAPKEKKEKPAKPQRTSDSEPPSHIGCAGRRLPREEPAQRER